MQVAGPLLCEDLFGYGEVVVTTGMEGIIRLSNAVSLCCTKDQKCLEAADDITSLFCWTTEQEDFDEYSPLALKGAGKFVGC